MKKVPPASLRRPSVEEDLAKIEQFKNMYSHRDERSYVNGVDLRWAQKKQKNHRIYLSVFAMIGLSAALLTGLSFFFQFYWLGALSIFSGISLAVSAHIWIADSTIAKSRTTPVMSASHYSNGEHKCLLQAFSTQKSFKEGNLRVVGAKKSETQRRTPKFKIKVR